MSDEKKSHFEERIAALNEKLFKQLMRRFAKSDIQKHLKKQKDPLFVTNQLTKILTSGGPMNLQNDLAELSLLLRTNQVSSNGSSGGRSGATKSQQSESVCGSQLPSTKSKSSRLSCEVPPQECSAARRRGTLALGGESKVAPLMMTSKASANQDSEGLQTVKQGKKLFRPLAEPGRKALPPRPSSAPPAPDPNSSSCPAVVVVVGRTAAVRPQHSISSSFLQNAGCGSGGSGGGSSGSTTDPFLTEAKRAFQLRQPSEQIVNISRGYKYQQKTQIYQTEVDAFPVSTAHDSFQEVPAAAVEKTRVIQKGQGNKSQVSLVDYSSGGGRKNDVMRSHFQDSYKCHEKEAYIRPPAINTNAHKPQHAWLEHTDYGVSRATQKVTTMNGDFRPFTFSS